MNKFSFFLIIFCCFSLCSPAWADNEHLRRTVLGYNVERVRAALENGVDPNHMRDDELSVLALAVTANKVSILQLLLQHRGDPNHPTGC
jgi:hypothetical protein